MNILIADDEPAACEHLSCMIESLPGCYDVGHASNGIEAVYKAYDLDIDVVLMDVRMPRMDGLKAAQHLSEFARPPAVIFTTAYSEHALEAFSAHALGFLLKPVQATKLSETLEHLRHRSAQTRKVAEPAVLGSGEDSYICCRVRRGLDLIALNRIIYIKSSSKCTTIHHLHGYSLSDQSLKVFEQEFGHRLLRVHRNALVNRAYVSGIEKGEDGIYFVTLRGSSEKLEISRRNLPQIREYLHTFIKPKITIRRREQFLVQYEQRKRGAKEE